jgi:hypothetical protein
MSVVQDVIVKMINDNISILVFMISLKSNCYHQFDGKFEGIGIVVDGKFGYGNRTSVS